MKAHNLVAAGLYATVAKAIVGSSRTLNMVANGTTQATATLMASGINVVNTVGLGGAAILLNEGAARITVCNAGANPLVVFTPLNGFMNGVSGATATVPSGKAAQFLSIDGLEWFAIVSA